MALCVCVCVCVCVFVSQVILCFDNVYCMSCMCNLLLIYVLEDINKLAYIHMVSNHAHTHTHTHTHTQINFVST